MHDYSNYDGLGLAQLVKDKEVSASELAQAAIDRIEALNPQLNAVIHKSYDLANEMAGSVNSGSFQGVPFLIKDLGLQVAGLPRTDGTRFRPSSVDTRDDLLTTRYRDAGLVFLGKTNTPEYGITGTTESQRLGPSRSPWNTDRITGGSSGGSASAVAAGIVPVAHASDGLGSIRIPAACCGLVGLKPSRGRVPLGAAHDTDLTVGYSVHHVVSRTVRDSAAMLDDTAIPDPTDPIQQPDRASPGQFLEAAHNEPGQLRIAFSDETPSGRPIDAEVRDVMLNVAKQLEGMGHIVEERGLGIPYRRMYAASNAVLGANFATAMAERVTMMGREPKEDELEALTWRNWQAGKRHSGEDIARARRTLSEVVREILTFFNTYDIYLCPVLATEPPPIGFIDPVGLAPREVDERQAKTFPFTPPFNISGQPGISLPLGQSKNGLPIAMMFHARYGDEATLLSLASVLEQSVPWKERRPQVWM